MGVIMMSGVSAGQTGAAKAPLAKLGLRKPPSGNPEGLALLGEPVWVGAFGWGHWLGKDWLWKEGKHTKKICMCICRFRCAGKVQKNYTYTQYVLTYQCMYVGLCILHGRRHRGQGATAPLLWRGGGAVPVPSLTFWLQISPPTSSLSFLRLCGISRDIHGLQLVDYNTQIRANIFTKYTI